MAGVPASASAFGRGRRKDKWKIIPLNDRTQSLPKVLGSQLNGFFYSLLGKAHKHFPLQGLWHWVQWMHGSQVHKAAGCGSIGICSPNIHPSVSLVQGCLVLSACPSFPSLNSIFYMNSADCSVLATNQRERKTKQFRLVWGKHSQASVSLLCSVWAVQLPGKEIPKPFKQTRAEHRHVILFPCVALSQQEEVTGK